MTPFDLILWGIAAAVAIVIVGFAVVIVLAGISTVRGRK